MPSHRFSIFASVGLEIAWACRCCWTAGSDRTIDARGAARMSEVRSMVAVRREEGEGVVAGADKGEAN